MAFSPSWAPAWRTSLPSSHQGERRLNAQVSSPWISPHGLHGLVLSPAFRSSSVYPLGPDSASRPPARRGECILAAAGVPAVTGLCRGAGRGEEPAGALEPPTPSYLPLYHRDELTHFSFIKYKRSLFAGLFYMTSGQRLYAICRCFLEH